MNTNFIGRKLVVAACFASLGGASCSSRSSQASGSGALTEDSSSTQSSSGSSFPENTVVVNSPSDLVQSGFDVNLHLQIQAEGLMSSSDLLTRVSRAISASDGSGNAVAVHVTSVRDDNGVDHLDIAAVTPLAANSWYYVTVSAIPGVEIVGGRNFTVNVHTGDIVYVEYLQQPTDPNKEQEVDLQFTQKVDFDARWSTGVLADTNGKVIPACVDMNGECKTEGHMMMQDAQLTVPKGSGASVARLIPGIMKAAFGHAAVVGTGATAGAAVQPVKPLPDGSLPLAFQPCVGSGKCAFF